MRGPVASSGSSTTWAPGGLAFGPDGRLYAPLLAGQKLLDFGTAGAVPTTILMHYSLQPESGRDWHDYYTPAVDALGWDAYNSPRGPNPVYRPAADYVDPVLAVARETGKPFGWAEFGSPCLPSDPDCSGRAQWLASVGKAFRDTGQYTLYWNQKTDIDYTLADARSVDTYRRLVTG